MRAIKNKLIVEPVESKDSSERFIVASVDEKPLDRGIIISKGPKATSALKEGDTVTYNEYGGKNFILDGKKYILLSDDEIYAVL